MVHPRPRGEPGGGQEEVAIIGRSEEREWSDIERRSRELAGRFLAGDRRSFDRLILLHQSMVYSLCLRLLGDPDEADDAAQEVFIRVYRYIGGFGFRSSLRTWLYRIAVNTCRSRMGSGEAKMRKRSVRLGPPGGAAGGEGPAVEIRDGGESPMQRAGRREAGALIEEAIASLPADQRTVVVLRDVEGRSYEELVEITGLNMGTVKSRLSRARLKLREMLRGKLDA